MPDYIVQGYNRQTGGAARVVLSAINEAEARHEAAARHIRIAKIELQPSAPEASDAATLSLHYAPLLGAPACIRALDVLSLVLWVLAVVQVVIGLIVALEILLDLFPTSGTAIPLVSALLDLLPAFLLFIAALLTVVLATALDWMVEIYGLLKTIIETTPRDNRIP